MKIDHAIDLYTEHIEHDPLALLPDDLRLRVESFWQSLSVTDQRASCPICDAIDLEMRFAQAMGKRWDYILHCGGAWLIGYPLDEVNHAETQD